uniref:Trichothecene 3-O-esterase n=1 Tax=Fusarium asiaticum TaxID=282267 RepID=A0A1S7J093_FUSAS|nr:trichothecene 3-O-esterase [Fusarium asiaticum]
MALDRLLFLLSLWLGFVGAAQAALSEPLPPSKDPWYTAPPGFENAEPGTVLRVRPAPGNLTSVTGNCSASYNILYRTTDSHFKPTWAVTTLLVPELGPESNAHQKYQQSALMSLQVAYDSPDVDASPSNTMYTASAISSIYYEAALAEGIFVSVPDYEGPSAAFTAGIISGYATLDSIRAVLSLGLGFNMTNTPSVALWGYSGGAFATEWASELAVQYAPELVAGPVVGAAMGAPLANITSIMYDVNGGPTSGLTPNMLLGLTVQYPDVRKHLVSKLNNDSQYNKTDFLAAEGYTITEAGVAFSKIDINKYFQKGTDIFSDPEITALVNREGVMGYHGTPRWPMYIYQAIPDEVTPIAATDAVVKRYCAVGADILFERNTLGSHYVEANSGYDVAFQWLLNVFAGQHDTKGCVIKDVTRNVNGTALKTRGDADKSAVDFWTSAW